MTSSPTNAGHANAVQRRFRFREEARAASLARMDVVKYCLHCDEDYVLYLIGDRQLVAFDLGLGNSKRLPGVWSRSLLRKQDEGSNALSWDESATQEAIADLLPVKRTVFGLTELKKIFGVTSTHIHHLIEAGFLTGRGGDKVSKAPQITRASAAEFLIQRRIW